MPESIKSSDLTLLLVCVCFAFYILISINLGGEALREFSYWADLFSQEIDVPSVGGNSFPIKIADLGVGVLVTMLLLMGAASFLAPKGMQAAGTIIYALICVGVFTLTTVLFARIPYIGVFLGPFFGLVSMLILYFDITGRLAEAG